MANPQLEDGHTSIANDIIEALAHTNLKPYESRILWAVIRKTYGWHKKMDYISLIQLNKLTKLPPKSISPTLKRLSGRNILIVEYKNNKLHIGLQKNYEEWLDKPVIAYNDPRPWYRKTDFCENCLEQKSQVHHHIIPKSLGGSDNSRNLISVCHNCHGAIHKWLKTQDTDDLDKMYLNFFQHFALEYIKVKYDEITDSYHQSIVSRASPKQGFPKQGFPKQSQGFPKQGTKVSPKQGTTKEKKETIQKKKDRAKKSTDPNIKIFLDFYHNWFLDKFGKKPNIQGGKHGKLAERLLKKYSLDELKRWFERYLNSPDPRIKDSGYTLEFFEACIQKFIIEEKRGDTYGLSGWLPQSGDGL